MNTSTIERTLARGIRLSAVAALLTGLLAVTPPARATNYVVENTNNSGPGSLRQAITDANIHTGPDIIDFNIPKTDPGYQTPDNVWFIWPSNPLPCLNDDGTTIDGFTQTTHQGDTNPDGPEVMVHGGSLSAMMNVLCIGSDANTIKGLIISYAPGIGILLTGGASGNTIIDNYIGTDSDGDWTWPNETGIKLWSGANNNNIEHNIISGNKQNGILIADSGTDYNTIRSNIIGFDRTGTKAVPNGWDGIAIADGAVGNEVGGSGYRNYIGGNGLNGVHVYGNGSNGNTIVDNYIGIDANGTGDVGNGESGIAVRGGAQGTSMQENVISGNDRHGVIIEDGGTDRNLVIINNIIGANVQGTGLVPNGLHGVGIYGGAQDNTINGNVIVGSGWTGVAIVNVGSDGNIITHNAIGTNSTGTDTNLGNGYHGVHIVGGSGNFVYHNQIAYNGTQATRAGVLVDGASATFNTISENSIHDNSGKGIELTNGGNSGLVTPTVTQVSGGQVDGSACAGCTVEVFADTADEGGTYLGTTTADAIEPAFTWSGTVKGPNVTVTATDSQGNTSEFSAPVQAGSSNRIFLPIVLRNF
jgi:parallel beta-helix repeat protein